MSHAMRTKDILTFPDVVRNVEFSRTVYAFYLHWQTVSLVPGKTTSKAVRELNTSSDASREVRENDLRRYTEGGETARTAVSS